MNQTFKRAMNEAAKLTASGQLGAATAAIQELLAESGLAGSQSPLRPSAWRPASRYSAARTDAFSSDGGVIDVEGRWVDDRSDDRSDASEGSGPFRTAGRAESETRSGTFANAAGRRDYLLHVPRDIQSASGSPGLVIMLHGCTQTPADFAAGTNMNQLADQHGFLVLYPAQSRTANQSACWNWFNPADQGAGMGEPAILAAMAREIADQHRVDSGRIFAAGLSAGGAMAAILADACPDLVSAVAVHSGLPVGAAHDLPSALEAMKRGASSGRSAHRRPTARSQAVRTIVFHGRQDRTVHPDNGAQVAEAALAAWPAGQLQRREEAGRSPGGRSYVRTVHADSRGHSMVERWEVQGAGHAWSGGSSIGSHTDPKGPDASAAMINFFLAQDD